LLKEFLFLISHWTFALRLNKIIEIISIRYLHKTSFVCVVQLLSALNGQTIGDWLSVLEAPQSECLPARAAGFFQSVSFLQWIWQQQNQKHSEF